MDETADPATGRKRSRRVMGRLPKVVVRDRAEMAAVLRTYRWLLKSRAKREFGDSDDAELVVRTAVMKVLSREELVSDHALALILQVLRNECSLLRARREREAARKRQQAEAGALFDPVLGWPLAGAVGQAVNRLPPAERKTLLLAFEGLRPSDIASMLDEAPNTIRKRLARARGHVRRMVEEEGGQAVPALLITLFIGSRLRRLSRLLRRATASPSAAYGPVGTVARLLTAGSSQLSVASLAGLVTLLASSGTGSAQLSVAPPSLAVSPAAVVPELVGSATPSALLRSPSVARGPLAGFIRRHTASLLPVGPGSDASVERPDDADLVAAAQGNSEPQMVVALGIGHECACMALFASSDGGRTWRATAGPPTGAQVALPPNYPRDSRIFVGTSAQGGASPYVAERYGSPFKPIARSLPAGRLALSAAFDNSDPRVFVAGEAGVVAVRLGSAADVRPMVVYPSTGQVASLATPTLSAGPSVLIAAPPASVLSTTTQASAGLSTLDGAPELIACDRADRCDAQSTIPLPSVQALVLSADFGVDGTVIAMGSGRLASSVDQGRSFQLQPRAAEPAGITSVAASRNLAWTTYPDGKGGELLRRLARSGPVWQPVGEAAALPVNGVVVALGGDRLLYLAVGHGYLCSADGGASWETPCPVD